MIRYQILFVLCLMLLGCKPISSETSKQAASPSQQSSETNKSQTLVIDDFSQDNGRSTLGATWRGFTDQVMGGVSTGSHTFEEIDGISCIRLQGRVSLENNGGFVMISLDVTDDQQALDAGEYSGLRMTLRGNGEDYFVHLKTSQTPGHSQYYEAVRRNGRTH